MKKILVILILFFAFGCGDDATDPSDNELVGIWVRQLDTEELEYYKSLALDFRKDGTCITTITLSDGQVIVEDNTCTYENNTFVIKSYFCEGAEGKYTIIFRDNGIELKLLNDDCERSIIFIGFFEKVED